MKYLAALLTIFAGASAAATTEPVVSYDGYKVFRVPVATKQFAATLDKLSTTLGLSMWKPAYEAGDHADIAVPPTMLGVFQSKVAGLNLEVMHEDLGKSIAQENTFQAYDGQYHIIYLVANNTYTLIAGTANATWFDSYHPYRDHATFLKNLQSQYSANSALISTGRSGEGNDLGGIHIFGSSKGKKAVVFHGHIHAREWITSMVTEYIAWSLLSNAGKDEVKGFLEKYDIYIFPITNPDGKLYISKNNVNF